jgi:hypothetical protein
MDKEDLETAGWLGERFGRIEKQLDEIKEFMSTTNETISAFTASFGSFVTDQQKFNSDFATFVTNLNAFLASLSSGQGGTTLSSADQASLNALVPQLSALDAAATSQDTTLAGIALPTSPGPAPTPALVAKIHEELVREGMRVKVENKSSEKMTPATAAAIKQAKDNPKSVTKPNPAVTDRTV